MSPYIRSVAALLAAVTSTVLLAACDTRQGQADDRATVSRHITIADERVGAIATDGRVAWVDGDGNIEIDATRLDLSADQHTLAADYHQQAMTLQDTAKAIGLQGARVAGTAISEVTRGLVSGDPDAIGERVEKEAEVIEAQAQQLCHQLRQLRDTQDALGSAVPAFKPFGTIDARTAEDCDSARGRTP